MYSCTIKCNTTQRDVVNISELFKSEKSINNNRAKMIFKVDKNQITFKIEANDAVAMRATANSVMKALSIYDKVKKV